MLELIVQRQLAEWGADVKVQKLDLNEMRELEAKKIKEELRKKRGVR